MKIPSLEDIKEIAKYIGLIASSTALYLTRRNRKKTPVEELHYLRRKEDAGLREVVGALTQRINNLEKKYDEKFDNERNFMISEIHNSEERITESVNNLGQRFDSGLMNINTRLDNLLRK